MESLPQIPAKKSTPKVVVRRCESQASFMRPLRRVVSVEAPEAAPQGGHLSAKAAERPRTSLVQERAKLGCHLAPSSCSRTSSAAGLSCSRSSSAAGLRSTARATERSRSSTTAGTASPSPTPSFSPASTFQSSRGSRTSSKARLALPLVADRDRSRPLSGGSSRASSKLSRRPSDPAPFGPEEAVRVPDFAIPQQPDSEGISPQVLRLAFVRNLARKHGITVQEVQRVLDCLESASSGRNRGLLDLGGLLSVLRSVTGHERLTEKSVMGVWDASMAGDVGARQLDINALFSCYVAEKGWTDCKESTYWAPSEAALREIARRHCVPTRVIEKVYAAFGQVDRNGSGGLCLPEFRTLLQQTLGPQRGGEVGKDLDEECIMRLWSELDADGSGEVDFPEFAPWYLRHFDIGTDA